MGIRNWVLEMLSKLLFFVLSICSVNALLFDKYPEELDWANYPRGDGTIDLTGPVHNEGSCGSTWAIGVVVVMDTKFNIAANHSELLELSDQEATFCPENSSGCSGGEEADAAEYAEKFGLTTEECYPYDPQHGHQCSVNDSHCGADKPRFFAKNHRSLPLKPGKDYVSEETIIAELQNGPVCADYDATDIAMFYTSGVYTKEQQKTSYGVNHDSVIVGYGTDAESGVNFWKLKNCWGTGWGEDGYLRIERGANVLYVESSITTVDIDIEKSSHLPGINYGKKGSSSKKINGYLLALTIVAPVLFLAIVVVSVFFAIYVLLTKKEMKILKGGELAVNGDGYVTSDAQLQNVKMLAAEEAPAQSSSL